MNPAILRGLRTLRVLILATAPAVTGLCGGDLHACHFKDSPQTPHGYAWGFVFLTRPPEDIKQVTLAGKDLVVLGPLKGRQAGGSCAYLGEDVALGVGQLVIRYTDGSNWTTAFEVRAKLPWSPPEELQAVSHAGSEPAAGEAAPEDAP